MNTTDNISAAIEQLVAAGMSQQQIAEHVGVRQSAISKLLRGERKDMLHSNALRLVALYRERLGEQPEKTAA